MTETKATHTPGKWFMESDGAVAMGGQVCIVGPAPDGASRDEELANARLIAAAPDLLAAAEAALREMQSWEMDAEYDTARVPIEMLTDAIAKAKGGA